MKFGGKTIKAVALLALFGTNQEEVHAHGTEVRYCVTADGNLRIFIEHWHGDLGAASEAGTMDIRDELAEGTPTTTLFPNGYINTILPESTSFPGCGGLMTTLGGICPDQAHNDWVWYDFPTGCGAPVSYTLIVGNTVYLTEACTELYPLTISATFGDALGPSIKVDRNDCDGYIHFEDFSGPASFTLTAVDDCDPNPMITSATPANGFNFPVGDTSVAVDAVDNTGKTSSCTFTVRVLQQGTTPPPTMSSGKGKGGTTGRSSSTGKGKGRSSSSTGKGKGNTRKRGLALRNNAAN